MDSFQIVGCRLAFPAWGGECRCSHPSLFWVPALQYPLVIETSHFVVRPDGDGPLDHRFDVSASGGGPMGGLELEP